MLEVCCPAKRAAMSMPVISSGVISLPPYAWLPPNRWDAGPYRLADGPNLPCSLPKAPGKIVPPARKFNLFSGRPYTPPAINKTKPTLCNDSPHIFGQIQVRRINPVTRTTVDRNTFNCSHRIGITCPC